MQKYLESSEFINWKNPQVQECSKSITDGIVDEFDIVKACFEYVRDSIKHSFDYQINTITCKASDVLKYRTGYCYAKSHLLAALLRANNVPAGLCYQRLSLYDNGAPYSLHGLNAVFLQNFGWFRVDARGNKEGVDSQFIPPQEQLAFSIKDPGESDIQGVWDKPMSLVVNVLQSYDTLKAVDDNLPDIEIY